MQEGYTQGSGRETPWDRRRPQEGSDHGHWIGHGCEQQKHCPVSGQQTRKPLHAASAGLGEKTPRAAAAAVRAKARAISFLRMVHSSVVSTGRWTGARAAVADAVAAGEETVAGLGRLRGTDREQGRGGGGGQGQGQQDQLLAHDGTSSKSGSARRASIEVGVWGLAGGGQAGGPHYFSWPFRAKITDPNARDPRGAPHVDTRSRSEADVHTRQPRERRGRRTVQTQDPAIH